MGIDSRVNFFTAVTTTKQNSTRFLKALKNIDNYFYITGKKVKIFSKEGHGLLVNVKSSNLLKVIKIISYFTVIIPLTILVTKAILRSKLKIELVSFQNKFLRTSTTAKVNTLTAKILKLSDKDFNLELNCKEGCIILNLKTVPTDLKHFKMFIDQMEGKNFKIHWNLDQYRFPKSDEFDNAYKFAYQFGKYIEKIEHRIIGKIEQKQSFNQNLNRLLGLCRNVKDLTLAYDDDLELNLTSGLFSNPSNLDVSQCHNLTKLEIGFGYNLNTLNLRNLHKLSSIIVFTHQLKEIDLKNLTNLKILYINSINLKKERLEDLPELKEFNYLSACLDELLLKNIGVKKLDVNSKILKIDSLPYLERLEYKNVKEIEITNLPNLESINMKYKNNLEKATFKNLPILTCLNLSYSNELKELNISQLEKLNELNLAYCKKLMPYQFVQMFNIHSLKYINLTSTNITSIPPSISNLRNLNTLNLNATNVRELPLEIIELAQLTDLGNLHLNNLLRNLRNVGDFQLDRNAVDYRYTLYNLETDSTLISQNMFYLMDLLGSNITENHCGIRVLFLDQPVSLDNGGLSRELFTGLWKEAGAMCFQDEGVPSQTIMESKTENLHFYKHVGTLLAFIIRTKGLYPTGAIFSKDLFHSIKTAESSVIDKDFDDLNIKELASLVSPAYRARIGNLQPVSKNDIRSEEEKNAEYRENFDKIVKFMQATSLEEANLYKDTLTLFFQFNLEVFEEGPLSIMQEKALNVFKDLTSDFLRPIHDIVKGFSKITPVWRARNRISVDKMSEWIMGINDIQVVSNSIDFNNNVSNDYKTWIREWLNDAAQHNPAKIWDLLYYMTGSRTLTVGQRLQLITNNGMMFAHTCSCILEIPRDKPKNELYRLLDLEENTYTSM